MAAKWYPVIDYAACVECGTCSNFCPHGVYDKSKSPTPVVVNPDGCIDHCHGCQNKCPAGAISLIENVARIDYAKCTACLKCVSVCPRKIIRPLDRVPACGSQISNLRSQISDPKISYARSRSKAV